MAAPTDEEQYFREHEAELSRRFAGKVVLIRGRRVVAVYEKQQVAEREAQREFGASGYLLKAISGPKR